MVAFKIDNERSHSNSNKSRFTSSVRPRKNVFNAGAMRLQLKIASTLLECCRPYRREHMSSHRARTCP